MENPIKMDDVGVSLFLETPIWLKGPSSSPTRPKLWKVLTIWKKLTRPQAHLSKQEVLVPYFGAAAASATLPRYICLQLRIPLATTLKDQAQQLNTSFA